MSTLEKIGIQQWRLRRPIDGNGSVESQVHQRSETEVGSDTSPTLKDENATASLQSGSETLPNANLAASVIKSSSEPIVEDKIDWPELERLVSSATKCTSCNAQNSLLGSGAQTADWLFVSDSPNSKEVASAAFFDGRAGQLFEAMLHAISLERDNVYCTSIFKCAPTEDLSNSPQCGEWVHHQIALVKPRVIIVFGEFTAQTLLKSNESLARMRESIQTCRRSDSQVIATHSPREMLEEPHLKAEVWADLKKAIQL